MRSGRETTQPNLPDLEYRATGLTPVYLEGALQRVIAGPIRVVAPAPAERPAFDEPAPASVQASAEPAVHAVLDPFSVYAKEASLKYTIGGGELGMRRERIRVDQAEAVPREGFDGSAWPRRHLATSSRRSPSPWRWTRTVNVPVEMSPCRAPEARTLGRGRLPRAPGRHLQGAFAGREAGGVLRRVPGGT